MSLNDLSKIIEWSVGVQLDRIKEIQFILLKGHLMLEVAVNHAIHILCDHRKYKIRDLSFHRKLQILENQQTNARSDLTRAIVHLRNLNLLRNRLAHELQFVDGTDALGRWSEVVLAEFPGTKVTRNTFRTKIIRAIGALAAVLIDCKAEADWDGNIAGLG